MTLAFMTWYWIHIKQLEDRVLTFYNLALVVTSTNPSYILFVEVVIKSHSNCGAEGVFWKTLSVENIATVIFYNLQKNTF